MALLMVAGPVASAADAANITNPYLTAQQSGSRWGITINWTAVFHPGEVSAGFRFATSYSLREADDTSADDIIINSSVGEFTPNSTRVRFAPRTNIPGALLDTEWGAEELYAEIHLRNVTVGGPPVIVRTPRLQISPG
jgi:hypothetical protein